MVGVRVAIEKPTEVRGEEGLGGKIAQVLGVDYMKVSTVVREAWTDDMRQRVKEAATQAGNKVAEAWERDDTLSDIAGKLANAMVGGVRMPEGNRRMLKAARFKLHKGGDTVFVVALPTVGAMDFNHSLKTGSIKYVVGGFVAQYRKTGKGLELVRVFYRGYDLNKIKDAAVQADPDLLNYARNKFGYRLRDALRDLGVSV